MLGTLRGNARDCAAVSFLAPASCKAWNGHLISLALNAPERARQHSSTTQTQLQPIAAGDSFFSDILKKTVLPNCNDLTQGRNVTSLQRQPPLCCDQQSYCDKGHKLFQTISTAVACQVCMEKFCWRSLGQCISEPYVRGTIGNPGLTDYLRINSRL